MSSEVASIVERLMAPVKRRVRMTVLRAVVKMVADERKFQRLQLAKLAGVVDDDVEHFQPYGFWSVPLNGAEALYFAIGGRPDDGVVGVVSDRRYRPVGHAEGESGLHFKETVLVRCAGPDDAPELHLGADEATEHVARAERVDAELSRIASELSALTTTFNGHVHVGAVAGTVCTASPTATPASPPGQPAACGSSNVRVNP